MLGVAERAVKTISWTAPEFVLVHRLLGRITHALAPGRLLRLSPSVRGHRRLLRVPAVQRSDQAGG